jgi:predicted PurR-regulated permease PerM
MEWRKDQPPTASNLSKETEPTESVTSLHIPFSTIAKILCALVVVYILLIIAPLLMTLFLGALLAVSLYPIVEWLETKGLKHSMSVGLIAVVMTASIVGLGALVVPKLYGEVLSFVKNLPEIRQAFLSKTPADSPLHGTISQLLSRDALFPRKDLSHMMTAGNFALGGLTEFILILVFAVYLLYDGHLIIQWVSAFFKPGIQTKIRQTAREVSRIIFAYVAGQFITSAISFIFSYAVLIMLGVPSALLLACLAGIFDVLPVLGFFLSVIPAMLFALSVSAETSIWVLVLYVIFNGIEIYLIVPAVYGNRLKVSTLVVLVSLIAAGLVAGIEGAIAILPVVASYPIIERIWLRRYVGEETVENHSQIEKNPVTQ